MAKPEEKSKARTLRRNGESIKAIAHLLHVSQSTVSLWVRDVELSFEQLRQLETNMKDPYYGKRHVYLQQLKKKRVEKENSLKVQGIEEVGLLSKRELFLVGTALYWAEGFKKDSQVGFANSDPTMIKLFIQWITTCCNYRSKDLSLRLTLNVSHKHRVEQVENYWSQQLNIPHTQFQKPYLQKVKWIKKYENEDSYYGVLRIKVRKSIDLLRLIHGWIEGLKNYSSQSSLTLSADRAKIKS